MKKKVIVIFLIIICLIIGLVVYKNYKAQKRYAEIRENVRKAVEWHLGAIYPFCTIEEEINETSHRYASYHSDYLNQWGAIKMNELLDVDNKSYCDAFIEIYEHLENTLDFQKNCQIGYKISLRCKNYVEEGYLE